MGNEPKGVKKYESVLKDICNVGDLYYLRGREWEGCIGVACILSYMDGVPATVSSMAKHLGFSPFKRSLEIAFERLKVNGVFGSEHNIRQDIVLKGEKSNFNLKNKFVDPKHLPELAWCSIAGIASGYIGLKEQKRKKIEEPVVVIEK